MIEDKIATFLGAETKAGFNQARISIAPPEKMKNPPSRGGWSYGEVKTPETINYRTFKPEKEGLFCEKIFGPIRDYECSCGKYKRIKHKGVICDRCGVEVTVSSVRRERMGHIELAVPVSHIWFLKSPPSRIGNILNLSIRNLERVIYYENYIVTDPGKTGLKLKQLLSEEEYQENLEKYGENTFVAKMGAEGVKDLLGAEVLAPLAVQLKTKLQTVGSKQTRIKLAKRLRIVEGFRSTRGKNKCRPEWMILDVIPVIPPDLRPLVPLEGGRFATSDLNDLYRRVINRNNRLKSILKLKTPEVIVRNEKRMLQEAVDALFDNGRQGRPVLGAGKRPLKSLSDNLRGKQGRFRQNLLGKRVDYSGRSVIVVGPELKLNQCGLPKEMALELFEPFIIKLLKERGYVHTIRSAKKLIERQTREVWDVLDEVTRDHPVMLNRAPTLHRLGIQAFDPILVEGKAIRLHPLVCTAFNADFDGDQMAVHVPLSREARKEARELMYAPRNIFSPASGEPIVNPTQDIALGCYYLTWQKPAENEDKNNNKTEHLMTFSDQDEVLLALEEEMIELHQRIKLRVRVKPEDPEEQLIETTAGRVIFNQILPAELGFTNRQINKTEISLLIERCYKISGHERTVKLLDDFKDLGFESSTWSGASLGMKDMVIPAEKDEIINEAYKEVHKVTKQHENGSITERERYNKIIDIWSHASEDLSGRVFEGLRVQYKDKLNPLFMMVDSGARGSLSQVQQLAGMRGLMANPSGDIIEYPITANFREGLSVLEYFISTHGARKGLADTALKTADSGYLTRRLVDVAQDLITVMPDCGALKGRVVRPLKILGEEIIPLKERIVGRVALNDIKVPKSQKVIVKAGEEITPLIAEEIEEKGIQEMEIRSVLSCESPTGVCCKCYGRDMANQRMVEEGEAVGIIAAQSIGEPGTQLTMRTFHIGGTASLFSRQPEIRAEKEGIVRYDSSQTVPQGRGKFKVFSKRFIIYIHDEDDDRKLEEHKLEPGSIINLADGDKIKTKDILSTWDPYNTPILTEKSGVVEYIDIIEGETMEKKKDKVTGHMEQVIKSVFHQDRHPQIAILNEKGDVQEYYPIAAGAIVEKKHGEKVKVGDRLGRTPRKSTKTADITGGLPRVAELFEARRPRDASEIARIGGVVEFGDRVRGKIKLIVRDPQTDKAVDHLIPQGKHLTVGKGDQVVKGQQLTEGPIVLQDLLEVCGMDAIQDYLIDQVQEVYRLQGVKIDDKHIEIITRQMVGKVKIIDPGDTTFLYDEPVDRFKFQEENKRVLAQGGQPATSENLLLGITKASLSTESFISAASFQETTRVLTNAAASSKLDRLKGFKENVIMGHLIPAGTGFPPLLKRKKEEEKEKSRAVKKSKEPKELAE